MSIDRMNFRLSLDGTRLEVCIELMQNGEPVGRAVMDASGLEKMIHQFADVRAQMADQVAQRLDHRSVVAGRKDPIWWVQRKSDGQVDMLVRDPGLGWLGFQFSQPNAQRIADVMSARKDGDVQE